MDANASFYFVSWAACQQVRASSSLVQLDILLPCLPNPSLYFLINIFLGIPVFPVSAPSPEDPVAGDIKGNDLTAKRM